MSDERPTQSDEILVRKVIVGDPFGNTVTQWERRMVTIDWGGPKPDNVGSYLMFGDWTLTRGES